MSCLIDAVCGVGGHVLIYALQKLCNNFSQSFMLQTLLPFFETSPYLGYSSFGFKNVNNKRLFYVLNMQIRLAIHP